MQYRTNHFQTCIAVVASDEKTFSSHWHSRRNRDKVQCRKAETTMTATTLRSAQVRVVLITFVIDQILLECRSQLHSKTWCLNLQHSIPGEESEAGPDSIGSSRYTGETAPTCIKLDVETDLKERSIARTQSFPSRSSTQSRKSQIINGNS